MVGVSFYIHTIRVREFARVSMRPNVLHGKISRLGSKSIGKVRN